MRWLEGKNINKCNVLYKVLFPIVSIVISTFILEFSIFESFGIQNYPQLKYMILNMCTVGIIWSIFFVLFNKIWVSSILLALFCAVIAIINHFVVLLHGMPLSFMMIKNVKTAMNVAGAYHFTIDKTVLIILLLMIVIIALAIVLGRKEKGEKRNLIKDFVIIVVCGLVFYCGYLAPESIKPKNTITWLWKEPYYTYGYTSCTVETIFQSFHYINKPEDYDISKVQEIYDSYADLETENTSLPDVIFILNETFYDLSQSMNIQTDADCFSNIRTIQNLRSGYAIVPSIGGGTNNTEYELLTSNSLQIMPNITPFNVIDMNGANSVVSHLEKLGYETFGAHSLTGENYARVLRYPEMGFDNVYFDDDFKNLEGHREPGRHTDESVYKNMISWYEEMPEEKPRFCYLLTYQNHSPFYLDEDSNDTVHVLNDLGEYTDEVNEFLSCVSLSDRAFKELTDYFLNYDRDVVICMVGDHAPSFPYYSSSVLYENLYKEDAELSLRKTPLLIWANFELKESELKTISMNQVAPTVLQMAGIPLNYYYKYLIDLKESVPIISTFNKYYDKDYNAYAYDDGAAPYADAVKNYFYLEYNNLSHDKMQDFFEPIK